ncbi:MAG: MtnX-like HAD-IB family phosphatase [Ignavibacteriaceae bacterium]
MDKQFKIFVDFDGTITKKDVGDAIFQEFGIREEVDTIISDLLSDKISAKECWLLLCGSIKDFEVKKINEFIDNIEIDSTFHGFNEYCIKNGFDVFILSDGFDYYINRIFDREKLSDIKVFCNKLTITSDRFIPEFPYEDEDCRTSANCKRNHIISSSSDEDFTFYIGDGNSDKHPAQYCDFIFAKKSLLKFCEKERITYFPYKDFNDIIKKLQELKNKKRLKKRHQAVLKRRERYMIE